MKKIRILLLSLALLTVTFIQPVQVHAEENTNVRLDDDYYIKSLDFTADVDKDNTWHITEVITYNFIRPHHGPVRNIIYTSKWNSDGKSVLVPGTIKKFRASSEDAVSKIANTTWYSNSIRKYVSYAIGSENETYTGIRTYVLKYDLQFFTDLDEINFNIVGVNWECPIGNVAWTINLPSEFDASKVGYSVGAYGYSGYDESLLNSVVDGTTIHGSYACALNAYEGINIRCELPQDYFTFRRRTAIPLWIILILCAMPLLFMIVRGKQKVIPVVEFYPPEGLDPVELECIYKGESVTHVTSLIPYLAHKGYLTLTEVNEEDDIGVKEKINNTKMPKFMKTAIIAANKNKDILFTSQCEDYAGLSSYAKTFLISLFRNRETVYKSDLKDSFYKTIQKIQNDSESSASKLWDKRKNRINRLAILCSIVAIIISVIYYPYLQYESNYLSESVAVLSLGIFGVVGLMFMIQGTKIFGFIFMIPFILVSCVFGGKYGSFAAVLFILSSWNYKKYKYRVEDTLDLYGRILGFKNFLETAEASKLRMLVEENPEYFFDILGYTYVFGVEDKWVSKFDDLQLIPDECDWYVTSGSVGGFSNFDAHSFATNFNSVMKSATSNMTSSPSSSSSGSSGGGSSGGGGGGGGGGAW